MSFAQAVFIGMGVVLVFGVTAVLLAVRAKGAQTPQPPHTST